MTARRDVPPLAPILGLPPALRLLAEAVIYSSLSSPDHLLLLADALHELATFAVSDPVLCTSAYALAEELRRRAPAYA